MIAYSFAVGIIQIRSISDDEDGEWRDASEFEDDEDQEVIVEIVEEDEE